PWFRKSMPRSSGQSAANPSERATGSGQELRHHVPAKPGELLHHGLLWRAHAVAQMYVLETGELLLDGVEQGDELHRGARKPRAPLHIAPPVRHARRAPAAALGRGLELRGSDAWHEA